MLNKTLQEHWKMCINLRHGNDEQKETANGELTKALFSIGHVSPIKAKALRNIVPKRKRIKVTTKNG